MRKNLLLLVTVGSKMRAILVNRRVDDRRVVDRRAAGESRCAGKRADHFRVGKRDADRIVERQFPNGLRADGLRSPSAAGQRHRRRVTERAAIVTGWRTSIRRCSGRIRRRASCAAAAATRAAAAAAVQR